MVETNCRGSDEKSCSLNSPSDRDIREKNTEYSHREKKTAKRQKKSFCCTITISSSNG